MMSRGVTGEVTPLEARALLGLKRAGVRDVAQVRAMTEEEFKGLRNVGPAVTRVMTAIRDLWPDDRLAAALEDEPSPYEAPILTERERYAMRLRFGPAGNMPFDEVGERLGVTRQRAHAIVVGAVHRLALHFGPNRDGIKPPGMRTDQQVADLAEFGPLVGALRCDCCGGYGYRQLSPRGDHDGQER